MAPLPPAELLPAVLGSHSTEPYWVALPILGLFMLMRVMRARARGGGPHGGGPGSWGDGSSGSAPDPPVQWDIRKAPEPEATPDASTEEHEQQPGDA